MNTRALAAKSIIDILNEKYSLLTLENKISNNDLSLQDKSFIKLLCYEFFRNYFSLEKIVKTYISSKTKKEVKILIMLGMLQIFEIKQPYYASINETVSACKALKIIWAKKLVNGVLRKILRNIEATKKDFEQYKELDLSLWLADILKKQYPKDFKEIIQALNTKANMFIRLNQAKNPQKVLDYLNDNQLKYTPLELDNCIKLNNAIDVKHNHLFQEGFFNVQDISAQYAGWIINPQADDEILDACAAPGGKTTHLLELAPKAQISAVDIIDKRIDLLRDNLNRILPNNTVKIIKQDLSKAFDGEFDKIILDAPCSALGTIKKNPDIKVLRTLEDIDSITTLQTQILQNLWDNNLREDGYLLYITCSILKQENQLQIEQFLKKNKNAKEIDIPVLKKYKSEYGYQILPSIDKGDGFYYCLLKKI